MMDLVVKNYFNPFTHAQRKRVQDIKKFTVMVFTTNRDENFEIQVDIGTPSEEVKSFIESIVLGAGTELIFATEKTQKTAVLYYGDLLIVRTMFSGTYYFYDYGKKLLEVKP